MSDPRGVLVLQAGGKDFRLWLGMSVLAELQALHGNDVLTQLDPPAGAGPAWTPKLQILVDLFFGALGRYHAAEADRYLVDDLLAENLDAFPRLMQAAFPEQKNLEGNGKRPKRAA